MNKYELFKAKLVEEANLSSTMTETLHDSYMIELVMSKVSALELAYQKSLVQNAMTVMEGAGELEGLMNLLDKIQDDLVESYDFPEEVVFPFINGHDFEEERINYRSALNQLLRALPREDLPKYLNHEGDELEMTIKKYFKKGSV
jgi:hypothetical protein